MVGYIVKHSHLGIGKVSRQQGNTVLIKFIAGKELSFGPSAFDNGSITHARLDIGSHCIGQSGECRVARVVQASRVDAPYQYQVIYNDGLSAVVSELELTPIPTNIEQGPLMQLAGLNPQNYDLFRSRELLVDNYAQMLREGAGLRALLSSRIDLHAHQAYVAGVVLLDVRRRYLLADEVGLGKTIEAGVIVHDLLTLKPEARILVLCPAALTQQWLCELYSKFGGQIFNLLDLHFRTAIPWDTFRKVIASTTLAAYDAPKELSKINWDMVVVDEAHHLLASPVLYEFVQQLSRSVHALLLLSAVPAQRREDDFLQLLALLEPDRYNPSSIQSREAFRMLYAAQSDIGRRLRRFSRRIEGLASGDTVPEDVIQIGQSLLDLDSIKDDEELRVRINSLNPKSQNVSEEAKAILHYVADRYRINRRILRNRRHRLVEEGQLHPIQRRFVPCSYQADQLEIEVANAVHALLRDLQSTDIPKDLLLPFARVVTQSLVTPSTARDFLQRLTDSEEGTVNRKGTDFVSMGHLFGYADWDDYADLLCMGVLAYASDELIERAVNSSNAWQRSGRLTPRFARLITLLVSKRGEALPPKLLLFVGFPGAVEEFGRLLRAEFGNLAVKEFRHDLSQEEKEQNVRQFQTNAHTWLLVSDETGGEGRNFQFVSELVHLDTPWYAARVEQRIGRVDRLGRERFHKDAVSNVIFCEDSIEHGLVNSYREGLKIYDRSISGLEFALRDVEQRIIEIALNEGTDGLFDHIQELQELAQRECELDESEALLDEASFELKAGERFRRVSRSPAADKKIEESFVDYFRRLSSSRSAKHLHDPTFPVGIWKFSADDVRTQLPSTPQQFGEFTGTFRREIAQQRPDLSFFNIGNPLFDAVISSLQLHSTGRSYAVACEFPARSAWTGFEFVFRISPDLKLLQGNYGLSNQALSLFTARPLHFFYSHDGKYFEDGDELLAIRRQLQLNVRNHVWRNLNENAELLRGVVGPRDWQDTVLAVYGIAEEKARQTFALRIAADIEREIERLSEHMRQLRERQNESDQDEIASLQTLQLAITNWHIELDGIGFLSINDSLLG
jgi:ATP-dependent helicase HepA